MVIKGLIKKQAYEIIYLISITAIYSLYLFIYHKFIYNTQFKHSIFGDVANIYLIIWCLSPVLFVILYKLIYHIDDKFIQGMVKIELINVIGICVPNTKPHGILLRRGGYYC